jgi:hypothetical protein
MKKVTYNTGEFKIDALSKALEDIYGPLTDRDRVRMTEESKKRQEEYDKMWYSPTEEELVEGFECEIQTSWGWIPGTWPTILQKDSHVVLFGGGATLRAKRKQDGKESTDNR